MMNILQFGKKAGKYYYNFLLNRIFYRRYIVQPRMTLNPWCWNYGHTVLLVGQSLFTDSSNGCVLSKDDYLLDSEFPCWEFCVFDTCSLDAE